MTAFTEKLDSAAGAALCVGLASAGTQLIGAGAVSLVAGGAGVVPITFGMAALTASLAACTWDSDAPGPGPSGPPIDYCSEAESSSQILTFQFGINTNATPPMQLITVFSYLRTENVSGGTYDEIYSFEGITATGQSFATELTLGLGGARNGRFEQTFSGDSTCKVPETPGSTDPVIAPYEYTDPVDGCSLTVYTEGWATDENGALNPVFKIEPASNLRQGGGVIGGCNFAPVIYTGNPGGPGEPPIIRPWDDIWDEPGAPANPWAEFLREVAAGVLGAGLADVLAALFAAPYAGTTYRLVSVCETDAGGEPISEAVEEIIPELPINDAILTRLDALVPLLQGQKDFKQPVCPPAKASGDLRTISFRSEEVSPNGKSCLRKRLRYRSLSGIGLGGLIDHWKDFSFSAGPVIVKNIGSTCGSLTVWASSVNEGKRVILHAFAEAGVDANQVGRWEVSSSTSTRRGMPGTMNIDTTGGYYWITARDGSSQRPIVGKT